MNGPLVLLLLPILGVLAGLGCIAWAVWFGSRRDRPVAPPEPPIRLIHGRPHDARMADDHRP